jgi:hypothetical protein
VTTKIEGPLKSVHRPNLGENESTSIYNQWALELTVKKKWTMLKDHNISLGAGPPLWQKHDILRRQWQFI